MVLRQNHKYNGLQDKHLCNGLDTWKKILAL